MIAINKQEAQEKIYNTKGKIFHATFIKKDGTARSMNARLHVKKGVKGVGMAFNPKDYELIGVYDMVKKGFRMINIKTLIDITVEGVKYVIQHS